MNKQIAQRIGVGVLLYQDGKLLLGKRMGSHGSGSWGLPGGHLEPGESVGDCASRETEEETKLQICGIRHVDFTNDVFPDELKQYVTLFVEAVSFSGVVENNEPKKCEQWRWFSQNEIPDNLFKPLQSLFDQGYCFPLSST